MLMMNKFTEFKARITNAGMKMALVKLLASTEDVKNKDVHVVKNAFHKVVNGTRVKADHAPSRNRIKLILLFISTSLLLIASRAVRYTVKKTTRTSKIAEEVKLASVAKHL